MAKPSKEQIRELFAMHHSPEATAERAAKSAAFDPTRAWVDGSRKTLSDRVWSNRNGTRARIDDVLRRAIAQGTDALIVADALEQYLAPGLQPLRDALGQLIPGQARRMATSAPNVRQVLGSLRPFAGSTASRTLARTEISRAHAQASELSATLSPFVLGIRWTLASRHPKADECSTNAERDSEHGPGVYRTEDAPRMPSHPNCLCHFQPVVEPDTDRVVDELRKMYRLDEP